MKFQLKCLNDGKEEIWHYDNEKNIVTDANGIDRFASYKFKEYKIEYPCYGEDTHFKISDHISDFYIVLGLKCNFHCKYCHQTDLPKDLLEEASPKKAFKLIEEIKNSGIQIDNNILFWGGEPLVYWKTLKLMIPEMRKIWKTQRFSIVTNGALLNDEKFEFFKKYNVDICVSYDGYHTLRDFPVFNDNKVFESTKKALKNGGHISILPLINNVSDKPSDIKKDLEKRFGHHVGVGFHSIAKCDSEGASFSNYAYISDERLEEMYKSYYEMLHKSPEELEPSLWSRYNEIRNSIARGIPWNSVRNSCAVHTGNHVVVNMNGNVLLCMNYPAKEYGHISDYKNIKVTGFYSHQKKKSCRECPYVNACFGVCPIIKDENGTSFKLNCRNYKPYAKAMIESSIDTLFGIRVLKFILESD